MRLRLIALNQTKQPLELSAVTAHLQDIWSRLEEGGFPLRSQRSDDTVVLEVVIVDDQTITKLNNQFCQMNCPTDVLSFPAPDNQSDSLGSVVVSRPTAENQAREAKIGLIEEMKMLAGHGLLHLLGYHH